MVHNGFVTKLLYSFVFFQKCSTDEETSIKGKDHTHFMAFLSIYLAVVTSIMIIFAKTDYKRRRANEVTNKHND